MVFLHKGYIQVWRLVSKRSDHDPFSGEGASKLGGRWNFIGTPIIYTASNISLGMLEILVNLRGPPKDLLYLAYWINVPEDAYKELRLSDLPRDVFKRDDRLVTQERGSYWVNSQESVALKVPSIVNQHEFNFLINPTHPDFKKKLQFCSRREVKEVELDARLFKGFEELQ